MEGKVYTERMIGVGTFLGGPLVAGYLFASNFKAMDKPEKAKQSWLLSIAFSIVLLFVLMIIPEDVNIPNQVIPLSYTIAAYYMFSQHQNAKVLEHLSLNGEKHSWWRVVLISLIGFVAIMAIAMIAFIVTDLFGLQ